MLVAQFRFAFTTVDLDCLGIAIIMCGLIEVMSGLIADSRGTV